MIPRPVTDLIVQSLRQPSQNPLGGVLSLTAIASAVCVPATQYKTLYGISVGYGLSVATMAWSLRRSFFAADLWISSTSISSPMILMGHAVTTGLLFYGVRLASFLWVRDISGWKPLTTNQELARWKRLPLAASLALFYACLVTPCLYLLRGMTTTTTTVTTALPSWKLLVGWTGTVLLWIGAVMEAVADAHKMASKLKHADDGAGKNAFHGPTRGVYGWTRHPNYTGEILSWVGLYVAGLPSFGTSVVAWVCSTAGVYGIVSIMRQATVKLEQRQQENYGGQESYHAWKQKVPAPLIPFVKG